MVRGAEKRRPRFESESAQSDQRPASEGAEIVTPSVDSWLLKNKCILHFVVSLSIRQVWVEEPTKLVYVIFARKRKLLE